MYLFRGQLPTVTDGPLQEVPAELGLPHCEHVAAEQHVNVPRERVHREHGQLRDRTVPVQEGLSDGSERQG